MTVKETKKQTTTETIEAMENSIWKLAHVREFKGLTINELKLHLQLEGFAVNGKQEVLRNGLIICTNVSNELSSAVMNLLNTSALLLQRGYNGQPMKMVRPFFCDWDRVIH